MQLFFIDDLSNSEIVLSEEESKHCIRVLRKKIGDEIILIDGKGTEAIATIVDDNPKRCKLHIKLRNEKRETRNYNLHIAIAPTKNFERMDWFIEKAVELGINEITFIESENSERTKINLERCQKIAIAAIKQSKQFYLPKLNEVIKLTKFMELTKLNTKEELRLIAFCDEKTNSLTQQITQSHNQNFSILIGPEGDFTSKEIELAKSAGFKTVSLGSTILRTETAGVFVCAALKTLLEK